jgi:hypothetical protein
MMRFLRIWKKWAKDKAQKIKKSTLKDHEAPYSIEHYHHEETGISTGSGHSDTTTVR